jgi:hypothetical protein
MTSCIVRLADGKETMDQGRALEVTIEVLFWNQCSHLFKNGMVVELCEGSRMVARGHFLENVESE